MLFVMAVEKNGCIVLVIDGHMRTALTRWSEMLMVKNAFVHTVLYNWTLLYPAFTFITYHVSLCVFS